MDEIKTESVKNDNISIQNETGEIIEVQDVEPIKKPVFVKNHNKPGVDKAVKDLAASAEKAAKVIGDAAGDVVDFAQDQFENAGEIMEKVSNDISESLRKAKLEKYRPVFPEKIEKGYLKYPEMINIVDHDKRMSIEEFKNAVGFEEKVQWQRVLGIYKKDATSFNIKFYPEISSTVYYVHPLDKGVYIEMSEYFKYLKEARVAELENIAQCLGAKYFRVSIMEEVRNENNKKTKANAKLGIVKNKASVSVDLENKEKKYESIDVAAESSFTGKAPERPVLKFWANDIAIQNLVEQRLSPDNPLSSKTYRLNYNNSTGIHEKEAAKIDAVLKALKVSGTGSVLAEAKKESRRRFEFKIEF